jgi:hypothetical protein
MNQRHKNEGRGGARPIANISKNATDILTALVRFALVFDAAMPVVFLLLAQVILVAWGVLK